MTFLAITFFKIFASALCMYIMIVGECFRLENDEIDGCKYVRQEVVWINYDRYLPGCFDFVVLRYFFTIIVISMDVTVSFWSEKNKSNFHVQKKAVLVVCHYRFILIYSNWTWKSLCVSCKQYTMLQTNSRIGIQLNWAIKKVHFFTHTGSTIHVRRLWRKPQKHSTRNYVVL